MRIRICNADIDSCAFVIGTAPATVGRCRPGRSVHAKNPFKGEVSKSMEKYFVYSPISTPSAVKARVYSGSVMALISASDFPASVA